jgi:hypothetical protein
MKVVAPSQKKNPPLLSMTLINKFERSCATFGEGKKNPLSSTTLGQFAPLNKNNNININNHHGVDVSMILLI